MPGAFVATSDPIELATEIMVAFVANNAVPRADLPALFEGLHSALKRLTDGGEVATAAMIANACGVDPHVGHAGLLDLSGGRQTI